MMLSRSIHQTRLLRHAVGITRSSHFMVPKSCRLVVDVKKWKRNEQLQRHLSSARESATATATATKPPLVAHTTSVVPVKKATWGDRARLFAQLLRYSRIVVTVGAVYGLGYQQGIIDSSRNPRRVEDELLQTILSEFGVRHREGVQIFTADDTRIIATTQADRLQAKTARVGSAIIRVASLYVREELVKAIEKVRERLPPNMSREDKVKIVEADEEVKFWEGAIYRVEGENLSIPWKYVLVESPIPNAFVAEILPQRFFITTSMFQNFISNEDELAVILGHEMAHLVLGHVSQRNTVDRVLRTVEVLALAIDPTEGMMSVSVIGSIAWLRGILMARFSREHETQADELGLKLAAMACYDTKNGTEVMKKMNDYQEQVLGTTSNNSNLLQLLDSHPPSLARYEKMMEESKTENPDKYGHTHCANIQRTMYQAVWGGRS